MPSLKTTQTTQTTNAVQPIPSAAPLLLSAWDATIYQKICYKQRLLSLQ
jgi:hypothetical protein